MYFKLFVNDFNLKRENIKQKNKLLTNMAKSFAQPLEPLHDPIYFDNCLVCEK
jgi:hypothetical protein